MAIPFPKHHFFQTNNQKAVPFTVFFIVWTIFQPRWQKKTYLKHWPLFLSQIFKFCCDIQGSHLIGCLWVSLIIDQSECLICYFLCTELTLFCTELPETCIYLNQSELSNFSMYIISQKINSLHSILAIQNSWCFVFCSYSYEVTIKELVGLYLLVIKRALILVWVIKRAKGHKHHSFGQ